MKTFKTLKYVSLILLIFASVFVSIWVDDYRLLRLLDKINATLITVIFLSILVDAFFMFKKELDSDQKNKS